MSNNRTDSKKKEKELREVVYNLDSKINYFYELSEYDEHWKEWWLKMKEHIQKYGVIDDKGNILSNEAAAEFVGIHWGW